MKEYKCIYSQTAGCPEYTGIQKGCPLTNYPECRIFGKNRHGIDSFIMTRGANSIEVKDTPLYKGPLDEKDASFEAGNDLVDIFRSK